MSQFIFLNDQIIKRLEANISVDQRGFLYGDGLFETIKMKNGKLLFEDEHFARLWKGLKVLEFDIPKHFTVEVLQKEINPG